jgi:hypothetical protein
MGLDQGVSAALFEFGGKGGDDRTKGACGQHLYLSRIGGTASEKCTGNQHHGQNSAHQEFSIDPEKRRL